MFPNGAPDVNEPAIRLKHWLLAQILYERFCGDAGLRYLRNGLPKREGYFLREEYYGEDSTHANAEFSKFYVQSVIEA